MSRLNRMIHGISVKHLWSTILFIFCMYLSTSLSLSADVDVYGNGTYTADRLIVLIYADIFQNNTDKSLLSFGVKLTYNAANLTETQTQLNDAIWYFGNTTLKHPCPNCIQKTNGEIIILGGKLDTGNPIEGVRGSKILLGSITFDSSNTTEPSLALGFGKGGNYKNFVATDGSILDDITQPESGVAFGEINLSPEIDSDGDGLPDSVEILGGTDPNLADTDSDRIPDGLEDTNHNGGFDAGETDPRKKDTDGDGFEDGIEDANQNGIVDAGETDPTDQSNHPAAFIELGKGFNIVCIPKDLSNTTAEAFLKEFGTSEEIERVMVCDDEADLFTILIPEAVNPNPDFIKGDGQIVLSKTHKVLLYLSQMTCTSLNLHSGFNLVGTTGTNIPQGYSAYDLLSALGSEKIKSIQRYVSETGLFESAGFDQDGNVTGIDFPVTPGEGYFIFMAQDGTLNF
ncbi:MAG: hypothetical protein JW786_13180 [Desulfobacterales bacterium]|nr:hypothetical protein [Desulfobacterales bacterium]